MNQSVSHSVRIRSFIVGVTRKYQIQSWFFDLIFTFQIIGHLHNHFFSQYSWIISSPYTYKKLWCSYSSKQFTWTILTPVARTPSLPSTNKQKQTNNECCIPPERWGMRDNTFVIPTIWCIIVGTTGGLGVRSRLTNIHNYTTSWVYNRPNLRTHRNISVSIAR